MTRAYSGGDLQNFCQEAVLKAVSERSSMQPLI